MTVSVTKHIEIKSTGYWGKIHYDKEGKVKQVALHKLYGQPGESEVKTFTIPGDKVELLRKIVKEITPPAFDPTKTKSSQGGPVVRCHLCPTVLTCDFRQIRASETYTKFEGAVQMTYPEQQRAEKAYEKLLEATAKCPLKVKS